MGDPPEGSVADQLVSIHPTRGHCFLRHLRCGAPKTEELGAINLLAVPALKVRSRSVAAFFVVSLVQEPEVSNVMSEDCAPLADGISQLLGITLSCTASV
jgi:hypothetical protein